jgi:hypothetical protein
MGDFMFDKDRFGRVVTKMLTRRVVLVIGTAIFFSCATSGNVRGLAELADSGEWALSEISGSGKTISIDRGELDALGDVFRDAFTLRIRAEGDGRYILSGRAAPNRFSMPVTVAENGTLTILPPLATLMAVLNEPEVLKEAEYLRYLANTTSIKESGGRLVLDTTDESGQNVSLMFAPSRLP